ncbi:MAG TPA: SAM-dependent methyltransferase [Steroidobacteraceae bacterium]|nr:SAM-dependent methyltransferase [Steroidobacteraceae bacterium]
MTSSAPRSILPPLSADEQQHTAAVAARLRETVAAAGGWLSFEHFMELALYAPGLGYYSAGSAKIGSGGDFVTAPEISDLFSRCVASQCAQVLSATGGEILELGAGTGRMALVVLESLAAAGVLPDRYSILEVSADLAERQRARLSSLPASLRERVVWLERLPERPLRGVILANEVLDALPCQRFVVAADGATVSGGLAAREPIVRESAAHEPAAQESSARGSALHESAARGSVVHELGVSLKGDSFIESAAIPDAALAGALESLLRELPQPLPSGYTSEVCLKLEPWIAGVGECLERGLILLFDYGLPRSHYYHPQRVNGTLRCHFKHLAHDNPYINVGVQDITAWVDFTRVAEAGVAAGLDVTGFCTQAAFLLATGIESLVAGAVGVVEETRLAGEARRLLMPGEMGEAFKAIALTRDYDAALRGFALQDLRHSL